MPNESELKTITISGVPKSLLRELEKLAQRENRNRSNYIVKTLSDVVSEAVPAGRPKTKAA